MLLLYVNHISWLTDTIYRLLKGIVMCCLFCVLFLLYTKHIICICGNENFIVRLYFDLNVHFVTEKRCILFRKCAIESCFKYM